MKKIIFYALALSTVFLLGCGGSKDTSKNGSTAKLPGIQFDNSPKLSNVLSKAENQNKLVFVDFYTSWCLPCKMMDQDVFTDRELGKYFNKNFVSYKVNVEKGNGVNLAYLYNVHVYPTLVFLDQKGNVLERKEGAAYHTELKEIAERALLAGVQ